MQNSARLFRIGSDIGVLVPIPWTASGRLFVAHMTLEELTAFIPPEDFSMQDGQRHRPRNISSRSEGGARARHLHHRRARRRLRDMHRSAGRCDPGGKCVACICFIVSSSSGRDRIEELTGLLVELARKVSRTQEEIPPIN